MSFVTFTEETSSLALNLALRFTEEMEVPQRYLRVPKTKPNLNTKLEKQFQKNIGNWLKVIHNLRESLEEDLTLRILKTEPKIIEGEISASLNSDFDEFTIYFSNRRSLDYDPEEIGRLAFLHTAFYRKIEDTLKLNNFHIKDDLADKLMHKGSTTIQDVHINFWKGHSRQTVSDNNNWNRIKSYAELNQLTDGENGDIVISGVFQIKRTELAQYAVKLGFRVHQNVSRNTDFIVVGSENVSPTKVAQALKLLEKGIEIRFVTENEFLELITKQLDI